MCIRDRGAAFIGVELALIQRFTLAAGGTLYATSLVLFGLLALARRAQERRVDQDDPAQRVAGVAGHHRRGHAAHRVAEHDRATEHQRGDQPRRVAGEVIVGVAGRGRARAAVPADGAQ